MIRTASFTRTFLETGPPVWLIFVVMLAVYGYGRGSIFFLFIPVWGALRLDRPDKPFLARLDYYLRFCLFHVTALLLVIYAAGFVLYLSGVIPAPSYWTSFSSNVANVMVMILIPFLAVRGLLSLPHLFQEPEQPVKSTRSEQGEKKNRIFAIDAVRGWVMIFMALDHAMYFCYVHIFAEGFQNLRPDPMPDAIHYLTRFITHYCATTFIFLAGASVALYAASRRPYLTEGQITRKLVTRGILIIWLQMIVVNWVWGFTVKAGWSLMYFGVLACIGSGLVILAFVRRAPGVLIIIGSVTLLLIVPLLLRTFTVKPGIDQPLLEILLQPDREGWLSSNYPILPWLGVMGLGYGCGSIISKKPEKTTRLFLVLGIVLLVSWLVLRLAGGYGNLTMYQGGDWRDFMLMSKYPPSLVFLFWNLGGMSLAIAGHNYFQTRLTFKRFWNIIVLFGQTPLFFYVVHVYLYRLLSFVPILRGSLVAGYAAWIVGLMVMIPLCKQYQKLKKAHPDSNLQYV
ncbi:MAG: heparan-alpha-glucosaminide N-acetyltransferase domain-containing protein [Candidatus Methanofastidiosia archaeon]